MYFYTQAIKHRLVYFYCNVLPLGVIPCVLQHDMHTNILMCDYNVDQVFERCTGMSSTSGNSCQFCLFCPH